MLILRFDSCALVANPIYHQISYLLLWVDRHLSKIKAQNTIHSPQGYMSHTIVVDVFYAVFSVCMAVL